MTLNNRTTFRVPTKLSLCDTYILLLGMYSFFYPLFRESTMGRILPQIVYTAFWDGTCLVLLIKIFANDAKNLNNLLKSSAVLLLLFLSSRGSQSGFLTPFLWFLAAGYRVDANKAIKSMLIGQLLSCVLIVTFAALGLIENITQVRSGIMTIRYSMGFNHPNTFGMKVFMISMMWIYVQGKRFNPVHLAVVLAVGFATYLLSNSQSAFLMTIMASCLLMLFFMVQQQDGWIARLSKLGLRVLRYGLVGMAALSFVFTLGGGALLQEKVLAMGQSTLVSRMTQIAAYSQAYSIKPFGQPLKGAGVEIDALLTQSYNLYTLDNAYMYLLYGLGWVMFVLFLLAYIVRIRRAIIEKDYLTLIIISIYALYGLTETGLIRFSFNFTLLLLLDIVWPDEARKKFRMQLRKKKQVRMSIKV